MGSGDGPAPDRSTDGDWTRPSDGDCEADGSGADCDGNGNEVAAPDAEPILVVRGRAPDVGADRAATAALLDRAADIGRPAVRAWLPARQVAFGRRDAHEPGYDRARRVAGRRGYRVVERTVGGRAVAFTGRTVAFARAVPNPDLRGGLDERYDAAVGTVLDALRDLGADVVRGEPPDTFCPGTRSIRAREGGKVAGVAQRIRSGAALVAGVVLVDDHGAQRAILDPVYDALGLPLDPAAVGSAATAGASVAPDRVARALEAGLVGGRPVRVEDADAVAERTS